MRGALIGCGFFGQIQHEGWQRVDGVTLVAACDPQLERAQALAPRAYTDPVQLLAREELDFVDIATRPDTHAELIRLAVARGIPAICQKPLTPTLAEAIELAALAPATPVMVHENFRWQPWYRELQRLLAEGAIGEPLTYSFRVRQGDGRGPDAYPNQPYFRQMPRLLVFETLVHFLDTARFLYGDIASVSARLRRLNPLIAGEDCALLTVTHQSGLDGLIDGHRFLDPDPPGPAMASATFEGLNGVIRLAATGELFLGSRSIYQPPPPLGYKGDSVRRIQQHFIDHLRHGTPLENSLSEYLSTFRAVEAAYLSAQEQRSIHLGSL